MRFEFKSHSFYDLADAERKRKSEAKDALVKARRFLKLAQEVQDPDMRRRYFDASTRSFERSQELLK